jgi:hypothetical protein
MRVDVIDPPWDTFTRSARGTCDLVASLFGEEVGSDDFRFCGQCVRRRSHPEDRFRCTKSTEADQTCCCTASTKSAFGAPIVGLACEVTAWTQILAPRRARGPPLGNQAAAPAAISIPAWLACRLRAARRSAPTPPHPRPDCYSRLSTGSSRPGQIPQLTPAAHSLRTPRPSAPWKPTHTRAPSTDRYTMRQNPPSNRPHQRRTAPADRDTKDPGYERSFVENV